jgi:hypothetical protein
MMDDIDMDDLAATLCEDIDCRNIAGTQAAPNYADSPADVKAYWLEVSRKCILYFGKWPK